MNRPVYQDLSSFKVPPGFRGRGAATVMIWQLVRATLFRLSPQPMYAWRRVLLRAFGAKIGTGVLVRPTARVTNPWFITIEDYAWVGDYAELYALAPIKIGYMAVVSQYAYLCAGTHDLNAATFPLVGAPIRVGAEAWICAGAFIHPGATIGDGAVIAARAVLTGNADAGMIYVGSPARSKSPRPFPGDSSEANSPNPARTGRPAHV